jgi:hypothetical protein
MTDAGEAIAALEDAAPAAVDRLTQIDTREEARKGTAKQFERECIALGGSPERAKKIAENFDHLPWSTTLQAAWRDSKGLLWWLRKPSTGSALKKPPMQPEALLHTLTALSCSPQDWQLYAIRRLAKDEPDVFGLRTGAEDQTAKEIAKATAERDAAFEKITEAHRATSAAMERYGLNLTEQIRSRGVVLNSAGHIAA